MELDRRKTGIIIVAGAGLIVLVLLVAMMLVPKETQEAPVSNVYIEHPDADVEELAESKMDVYSRGLSGRSSVEDYWDSIEETEVEQEDSLAEIGGGGAAGGVSAGGVSDLERLSASAGRNREDFDGIASQPAPVRATSSGGGARPSRTSSDDLKAEYIQRRAETEQKMLDMYMQGMTQPQNGQTPAEVQPVQQEAPRQEAAPEPERIQTERTVIRPVGGVSSLDDGMDGFSSSGISSLDGPVEGVDTDFTHPFRCMFVREEKIESGQRVSVRLLEDMMVGNILIPKNTHLMATCTLGERLQMKVTSIDMNGTIYSLNYDAYDNDGARGIYCPDVDMQSQQQLRRGGTSLGRRATTRMGAIAGEVANLGMTIVESVSNSNKKVVKVPQGYTFYLVQSKNM